MKGLIAALRWLTVLPLPASWQQDDSRAWVYLPAVGMVVGGLVLLASMLGASVDAWLGALLGLLMWFGVTGGLHADGLADVTDALGAAHGDKTRMLEVLKDSHVGALGVLAMVLVVAAKLVLLFLILQYELWLALVLIPAWARLGAAWWASSLPAVTEGSGKHWAQYTSQSVLWFWLLLLMGVSAAIAWTLLLAPVFIWIWQRFLHHTMGGMNGDGLGAGIEVLEVVLLMLILLLSV